MEYVPLGDLTKHIGKGLSQDVVHQIAYQVLDGLEIMHRLDIVHRDIKPSVSQSAAAMARRSHL